MLNIDKQNCLRAFADQSDLLFSKGIIRTDSFTGEIGEFVAAQHFNLKLLNRSTKGVDAVDNQNNKYQVKSTVTKGKSYNYAISNTNKEMFDYLVVVYFNESYALQRILKIASNFVPSNKFNISASFLRSIAYEEYSDNQISLHSDILFEVELFGNIFNKLLSEGIIRSRRVVGDIGEYYACERLGLIRAANRNEKGIDAVDNSNNTYEIKTRRVYESGRRTSETRRLNNLTGKTADYLIVVTLDRCFSCSGMWLIPMRNIVNPKSANLSIVKNTVGVKTIIAPTTKL